MTYRESIKVLSYAQITSTQFSHGYSFTWNEQNTFHPKWENERLLGSKVPYFNIIGAMYLTNYTIPNMTFSINLLTRYNSIMTRSNWNKIKNILWCLRGMNDIDLYYSKSQLLGMYPHKTWFLTRYVFTCCSDAISWKLVKQTIVTTLSNYLEILTIHKVNCKSVWLTFMIKYIWESYEWSSMKDTPTILHEDNVVGITQIKGEYIKDNQTNHISTKFFYMHIL